MKFQMQAMLSAGVVLGLLAVGTARADTLSGTYAVTVSTGLTNGAGFSTATLTDPFFGSNTASATLTYTGSLDFNNSAPQNSTPTGDLNSTFFASAGGVISNYNGSGSVFESGTPVANFDNETDFLASSGSASSYQYGSYYTINLGTMSAGTILTITHDDGISVFQNGSTVGSPSAGPTSETTDTIDLTSTADTILVYSRQNGTPSILDVSVTAATPEPSSMLLLGTGLLGTAGMMRRRFLHKA